MFADASVIISLKRLLLELLLEFKLYRWQFAQPGTIFHYSNANIKQIIYQKIKYIRVGALESQ